MSIKHLNSVQRAFTIIELLVTIAIVGILSVVALPSLSRFIVELRVDNEISELHRLLLITRNNAINTGNNVVICPLVNNICVNQWDRDVSVFVDLNQNGNFDPALAGNLPEYIIKVKSALNNNDKLQYGIASLVYDASGNILGNVSATPFSYCPDGYSDASRGIMVSALGRASTSQDNNGDGFEQDRNNANITCI